MDIGNGLTITALDDGFSGNSLDDWTDGTCGDTLDWLDPVASDGTTCSRWIGYDCNEAFDGYSSPAVVLAECPKTCGVCDTDGSDGSDGSDVDYGEMAQTMGQLIAAVAYSFV